MTKRDEWSAGVPCESRGGVVSITPHARKSPPPSSRKAESPQRLGESAVSPRSDDGRAAGKCWTASGLC